MIATIDLGGTRTKFGLVRAGKVIAATTCKAQPDGDIGAHLMQVLERLKSLCVEHAMELGECHGIGLLSTGLVDNRNMRVLSNDGKYASSTEFDFRAWAREHTGLELRLENDARGALLGEWHFGAGRGVDNLMMVTIGTGIGTAVIADGRLLRGASFSGGNLGGHILVNSGGRKCACGAVGCLESEASGWALPQVAAEHKLFEHSSLGGAEDIGFKEMLEHSQMGDACAIAIRDHCFRLWGEALVSYVHMFDPARIIIGGGLMNASEIVLKSFRTTVSELAWKNKTEVEIVAAEQPDYAGLLGASSLFSVLTSDYAC